MKNIYMLGGYIDCVVVGEVRIASNPARCMKHSLSNYCSNDYSCERY